MKKTMAILILGALSTLALAGNDHTDSHGGHDSDSIEHRHAIAEISRDADDTHASDAGRPEDLATAGRTVEVVMNDAMRFVPQEMEFKVGETVRFVVRNDGSIRHEMVIGSARELKEHAAMMRASPTMQHADPNTISLAPGERGELVWHFSSTGVLDFACLVPGHLEAGMSGRIEVE